jgi:hypothetical protein
VNSRRSPRAGAFDDSYAFVGDERGIGNCETGRESRPASHPVGPGKGIRNPARISKTLLPADLGPFTYSPKLARDREVSSRCCRGQRPPI